MSASPASAVHMTVSARKLFDSDFYLALETLRSEAGGPADTGRRFERLMRRAFETHPYEYGPERFESVWLWSDWPDRKALGYGADIGIDLVAKQTPAYGGGLCAIQCKKLRRGSQGAHQGRRLVPRSLGSRSLLQPYPGGDLGPGTGRLDEGQEGLAAL